MSQAWEKSTMTLRDGRKVLLRPLSTADRRSLLAFGHALPSDTHLSFTDEWHSPEVIDWLIRAIGLKHWRQYVATYGDMIAGYGVVLRLPGWSEHVAEIWSVISRGWCNAGLETPLAALLLDVARELGAEKAIVELSAGQQGSRLIFERLGFRAEGTLNAHLYVPKRLTEADLELERAVE